MGIIINPFRATVGRALVEAIQIQKRRAEKRLKAETIRIYGEEGRIFHLFDKLKKAESKGQIKEIEKIQDSITTQVSCEVKEIGLVFRDVIQISHNIVEHLVGLFKEEVLITQRGFPKDSARQVAQRIQAELAKVSRELDSAGDMLKGEASKARRVA